MAQERFQESRRDFECDQKDDDELHQETSLHIHLALEEFRDSSEQVHFPGDALFPIRKAEPASHCPKNRGEVEVAHHFERVVDPLDEL